jgi:hypothetical protein
VFSYPTAWVHLHLLLEELGQPDPRRMILLAMRPLALRVERNHFQEADKIELEIDGEDFPFDPRVLRGVTVEAFVASSDGVDPNFWTNRNHSQLRDFAVFAGVIDQIESTFDDEHRKFRLTGRDYTAYFLDTEFERPALDFAEGGKQLTLVEVLEKLVAQRSTTTAIEVDDRDGVGAQIIPARYRRKGGTGKEGERKKRHGETVWDVISEIAFEAGVIVYVELDRIVIRRPETIFLGQTSATPRTFTLGRDVSLLRYSRQLGRQHGISVQVSAFDPDTKKSSVARALDPQTGASRFEIGAARIGAGPPPVVKETRVPVRPFVVRGITDQTQLQSIADQILEILRHHELEGELEVREFTDTNGRALQDLAYGDAVAIQFSAEVQGFGFQPLDAQVRRLIELGYGHDDARRIVLALDALNVPFYVHRATHRFDAKGESEAAYSVSIEFRGRKQVEVAS